MTGTKLDPTPTIIEMLRLLDVPDWDKSVTPITDEDLIRASVGAQMQNPPVQGGPQGQVPVGRPNPRQRIASNGGKPGDTQTLNTPVGQVLAAPGDQQDALAAIRSASIAGDRATLPSPVVNK
jgi:hypothetical protein